LGVEVVGIHPRKRLRLTRLKQIWMIFLLQLEKDGKKEWQMQQANDAL